MIAPYNCVVVANGSFPQTALPLHLLHEASVVIACDGAVEALDKAGIPPAAIVGDLDSIPPRFRERYADRFHFVEDQEINDLTKSVRFAHRSGQQEVLILGATGLREDHTLGNISLLMDYAPLFHRIEMLSVKFLILFRLSVRFALQSNQRAISTPPVSSIPIR